MMYKIVYEVISSAWTEKEADSPEEAIQELKNSLEMHNLTVNVKDIQER